jgi:hypothetical protein
VSRESRLLLLTVVVCVVVLLLLARIRFPDPPLVETVAQPLERLAASASYDALAADIERVEAMIAPNLVVLRTALRLERMPRRTRDLLDPPDTPSDARHVAALRISPDTAVAAIAPNLRIDSIVGPDVVGEAAVVATDPLRRLSRVRVPTAPTRTITELPLAALRTPVYVVAVEGTQAGVSVRPVFLGRGNRFESARWNRPLLPVGGSALAPGTLIFSLAGEFIGCVVLEDGAPAIVGARDVLDTMERLAMTSPVPATLGIAVQPLTPALAQATRAARGVVVSEVDPDGPADGVLLPGDVLVSSDGQPFDRPDRFLLWVASRQPGTAVDLAVVRQGQSITASPVPRPAAEMTPVPQPVTFARGADGATRIVSARAGRGSRLSGLEPGDILVWAAGLMDPTPEQMQRLVDSNETRWPLAFTIRRGAEQRVVAVTLAAGSDVDGN